MPKPERPPGFVFGSPASLCFGMGIIVNLVVHAGVPPAIATLLEDPQEIVTYTRQQRDLYRKMQRIRFVSPEGKILQLGHECSCGMACEAATPTGGTQAYCDMPQRGCKMYPFHDHIQVQRAEVPR